MPTYTLSTAAPTPSPFDRRFQDTFPMQPLGQLPNAVDHTAFFGPVRNQGQEGACSAFSGCQVMEALIAQYRQERTVLSPAALYEEERLLQGDPQQDAGARLRATQAALQLYGVPPEADDPYTPQDFLVRLTPALLAEAARYRIRDGFWAPTLEEILNAVAQGFFPQIGVMVYESFETTWATGGGHVPMPSPGERALGGHALAVGAYSLSEGWVKGPNSWGPEGGDQGYFYLPLDYLQPPYLLSARVYTLSESR